MTIYIAILVGALVGISITLSKQRKAAMLAEEKLRIQEEELEAADRQIEYLDRKIEHLEKQEIQAGVLYGFISGRDGLTENEAFILMLDVLEERGLKRRDYAGIKSRISVGYQIFRTDPGLSQEEVYQIAYPTFLSATSDI
jgi:hypothetical protein